MKYFLDTEFHEYHKQPKILGRSVGKFIPTIDLISIGIVAENGSKFYAISKDFNIKDAWNSWQPKDHNLQMATVKEYWLRDNVLKPIFQQLFNKDNDVSEFSVVDTNAYFKMLNKEFTLKNFTKLINKYGKTNEEIANSLIYYVAANERVGSYMIKYGSQHIPINIQFYGYYADYDWVVLAQLFGRMMDLPKSFPMYCRDLKQMYDELNRPDLKSYPNYPKQDNEHNALADAEWNLELYKFISNIK